VSLSSFDRFVGDGFIGVASQSTCEREWVLSGLNAHSGPAVMLFPVNNKCQSEIAILDVRKPIAKIVVRHFARQYPFVKDATLARNIGTFSLLPDTTTRFRPSLSSAANSSRVGWLRSGKELRSS